MTSWEELSEPTNEQRLREEFEPIRRKYNLNLAIMLQDYLDKWIEAHTVEDFDINEIK